MRRHGTVSRKTAKTRGRKAAKATPSGASARSGYSSVVDLQEKLDRQTRELREAQEQQTATAEVLKIISASPTPLQAVLEVVAKSAARFCEADDVTIFDLDGQDLRIAAHWGAVPQEIGVCFPCTRGSVAGRTVIDRKPAHVLDLQAEAEEFPEGSAFARRLGHRTTAGVPLLREGVAIGTIQLRRTEVSPFTDKQITLLETFADQAVIAIENTRLLNELRQRTTDLTESLEQQTATSEVLKVISSASGELQPVFHALLEKATHLCGAKFGNLYIAEGDAFRTTAMHNVPAAFAEARARNPVNHPEPGSTLDRIAKTKRAVHIPDVTLDQDFIERQPRFVSMVELGGFRASLAVPMLKDGAVVGTIMIYRQETGNFSGKQIELLQNFAAQAVIAIENARLLNELRQRTTDLTETLEQQTATSKVLEVISRSAFDLQAVFEIVAESSVRLCGADRAFIYRLDGELLRAVVAFNASQGLKDFISQNPIRVSRESASGRVVLERRTIHIPDVLADSEYSYGAKDVEAIRTILSVPILKGDDLLGVIGIYTLEEVRPFTEKQIALVETFADQAAIAIDNVRLLDELRQSLEQQTATADMLKLISRSTFDLKSVLNTLVESAARLCEADITTISREKDGCCTA